MATGKSDWKKDVADEVGSVMEAVERVGRERKGGKVMLSACNLEMPKDAESEGHGPGGGEQVDGNGKDKATTVLLLPAFVQLSPVRPSDVKALLEGYVDYASTTTTPLTPPPPPTTKTSTNPPSNPSQTLPPQIHPKPLPHAALILLCSQRTRDARCGQSAPLLRREFERHLRPLGLWRDQADDRPGGVAVVFVSHVGGHKYSANCLIYRRVGAFDEEGSRGGDGNKKKGPVVEEEVARNGSAGAATMNSQRRDTPDVERVITGLEKAGIAPQEEAEEAIKEAEAIQKVEEEAVGETDPLEERNGVDVVDQGAGQCIWLARVRPEDCENIVRYTVLKGKVVKPGRQLRGGFDRGRGVVSW